MGYVIGQAYKRVVGFKNGSPVYEMTTVVAVFDDKIVLASGTLIDYVGRDNERLARDLNLRDPIGRSARARSGK